MKRKYIEENLELIGDDFLSDFIEALILKDQEKTLKNLAFLREKSLDVRLFLEQLLFFLRDRMKESLKKVEFGAYTELFEIFEGVYGRLKFSPDPFLLLETSTFRCIVTPSVIHTESGVSEQKENKNSSIPAKKEQKSTVSSVSIEEKETQEITPISSPQKSEENTPLTKPKSPFDFSRFVEHIRTVPKRSFV